MCTTNPGKLMEVRRMFGETLGSIAVRSPTDIGINLDVVEDGKTLSENAMKKITGHLQHESILKSTTKYIVIADDTGLEIESLGGTRC